MGDPTINLLNIVELENKIIDNDLKIFRSAIKSILNIKPIEIDGKQYLSLDKVVSICDTHFKSLSSNKKN